MDKKYAELVAAIIRQDLEDYKKALENIKNKYDVEKSKNTVTEVERFLRSAWFEILTDDLNGEILITQIKRMVNCNES